MTFEELKEIEIPITSHCKDITNQRFGKLIALFPVSGKDKHITWGVKCDCGNFTTVIGRDLRNGKITHCGCMHSWNIAGQKFGHLTAIKPTDRRINNSIVWEFLCDCGSTVYADEHIVKRGRKIQCDEHEIKEMIGKKFGLLTVLDYAYSKNQLRYYDCICECNPNKIITICGKSLNKGKYSCGCLDRRSIGEYNIRKILDTDNYPYIPQITFDTCRFPDTNALARFDFYISSEDCFLLEFDGPQHQEQTSGWNNEEYFIKTLNHDLYKNQWAYENEMPLKRIPYQYRDSLTINDIFSDRFLITPDTHPQYYPAPNSSYPYITL